MSFKNANTIDEQVEKALKQKITVGLSKAFDQQYADELKNRIIKRTKQGVFIDPQTGNSTKVPLKEITKKVRKGEAYIVSSKSGGKIVYTDGSDEPGLSSKAKQNRKNSFKAFFGTPKLSSTTTPGRSNLTATGQLLNSLTTVKVKLENGVKFIITVGDKRGLDMYGNRSKIGNKKLVAYQERQGRKFLGFTKPQINQITRDIRQKLINLLK